MIFLSLHTLEVIFCDIKHWNFAEMNRAEILALKKVVGLYINEICNSFSYRRLKPFIRL
jgi:hypothetical protein